MRIGIIGAGQLGQMLGAAARGLGYECLFLDPSESPPARTVGRVIRAAFDDAAALAALAAECDVVSYEFENVPVASIEAIEDRVSVCPPVEALRRAQDRLLEKRLFDELRIPLPAYFAIDNEADLGSAIDVVGLPAVIKTRRFGYDGKGQFVLTDTSQVGKVWHDLAGRAAIAESWVNFDFEVSVIGARNPQGEIAIWPLTQNEHRDGILHVSRAPLDDPSLSALASKYLRRLLDRLDYVGVLALELFVVDDRLLANEYAPRVHNSGHWTIEAAATSQFTNHLLAITGQALGSTAACGHAGMLNLIGRIPETIRRSVDGGIHLHDYGKSPRPGRKLGHVTVLADSADVRDVALDRICETVTWSTRHDGKSP